MGLGHRHLVRHHVVDRQGQLTGKLTDRALILDPAQAAWFPPRAESIGNHALGLQIGCHEGAWPPGPSYSD